MDLSIIEPALHLVLGVIILLAGRNIFWLFIAAIGFLVGAGIATSWLADHSLWLRLAVGLGAGLGGAILAIVFERAGFALAGFYTVVFLSFNYLEKLGFSGASTFMPYVLGLIGAVLVALLTDWAIILLSALAGASAILSVFALGPIVELLCLLCLTTLGVVVQRASIKRNVDRG